MARRLIDPQKVYAHLKDKVQWALCDRCGWHWPEKILNFREGRKVCPNHPSYRETGNMRAIRLLREGRRFKGGEPEPKWPSPPEMRGVSGVTSVSPYPLTLPELGGNRTLVLRGRNLSSADSIVLIDANGNPTSYPVQPVPPAFTAIDPDTRGNQVTFTFASTIPGKADYGMSVNGDIFRDVVRIR